MVMVMDSVGVNLGVIGMWSASLFTFQYVYGGISDVKTSREEPIRACRRRTVSLIVVSDTFLIP